MPDIDDLDEIVRTGERVPPGMLDADLLDGITESPVFDGERIVEQGEVED